MPQTRTQNLENPENAIKSLLVISLREFKNEEIAALNLALNGFGRVSSYSLAFNKAREFEFINSDGTVASGLKDLLLDALAFEINSRVSAGTFN